jgi:hypothetical protein
LEQAIQMLELPIALTRDVDSAEVILALRSHERKHNSLRRMAFDSQIPIYTVKANTISQITRTLRQILNLGEPDITDALETNRFSQTGNSDEMDALEEARLALEQIVIPQGRPVDLLPRSAYLRKIQHELVEHYHLNSTSFGEEPNRCVRIYPA